MDTLKRTIKRPKRSVSLTDAQYEQLVNFRDKFKTEVACAIKIKIDRNVLSRVITLKSGSPETIKKIVRALELNN